MRSRSPAASVPCILRFCLFVFLALCLFICLFVCSVLLLYKIHILVYSNGPCPELYNMSILSLYMLVAYLFYIELCKITKQNSEKKKSYFATPNTQQQKSKWNSFYSFHFLNFLCLYVYRNQFKYVK